MKLDDIALGLYTILDDIDAIDEVVGNDDTLYRELVTRLADKRHEYADADGYKIIFRLDKAWTDREQELKHDGSYTSVQMGNDGRVRVVKEVKK